jgi:hypothetical protein
MSVHMRCVEDEVLSCRSCNRENPISYCSQRNLCRWLVNSGTLNKKWILLCLCERILLIAFFMQVSWIVVCSRPINPRVHYAFCGASFHVLVVDQILVVSYVYLYVYTCRQFFISDPIWSFNCVWVYMYMYMCMVWQRASRMFEFGGFRCEILNDSSSMFLGLRTQCNVILEIWSGFL